MSSTDCLRLFGLCFWLLVGDVNCENTQRGYVLRVQAGQALMGIHNDNRDQKRLSETSIFRRPTAGYRMPSLDRGQSGYVYPAEQQHTIDSKSSQIQNQYPVIPETQSSNVNHFESGINSASATRGRNTVVYNRFGHKAFPDGKKIHEASSDSVFSRVSGGKGGTRMSYPSWSPRGYSSDVMSEARGYANVRRLKPGFDKTGPHVSSAAGKRFSETVFPSVNQNQGSYGHDSRKLGFGPGVTASSERQQNLNHNSRGSQPSSRHPPPDRAQILVQGKFKPFQRLPPTDDLPAPTPPSDASTQEAAETTLPPSLNSTGTTTVTEEMSAESASPMQTEAPDAELLPQASILEGQSGNSTEVGPSLEQNKQLPDSPPELQLAEDRKGDTVVTSPPETDQSSTDQILLQIF